MASVVNLLLLVLAISVGTHTAITHLNAKNYDEKLQEAPFTLVYFYSSSCKFCKEFTPVFEKLQKHEKIVNLGVALAKIDGPTYQNLTNQLEVYSYPSLLFYKKGVSLPIPIRRAREEKEILDTVEQLAKYSDRPDLLNITLNLTVEQQISVKAALFYGQKGSPEFDLWDVITKRDGFIGWSFVEAPETKLVIGNKQITDFSNGTKIEDEVAAVFARLHDVNEYSWLTMMQKKKFSIVYFNRHGNKKTKQLLAKIAGEVSDVNFLEIDGNHEEYKHALKAVGVHDEENIVAVDKKYDVLYIAPAPYTEEGLKEFIKQAKDHKLDFYKKTEKTEKPNKLTRDNFQAKMDTPQDVLLFLYDKTEPISKELMKLFEFLLLKLKDNKHLLLLRCDIGMNQVEEKLGFVIKPTPKLVFFRNRMKDYPIHFSAKTISFRSVVDFIMENTTFDFEDEWAEL